MNYLADLYNAKELYNVSHKEKANEVILGINVYRFIKNRIRHRVVLLKKSGRSHFFDTLKGPLPSERPPLNNRITSGYRRRRGTR